VTRTLSQLGLLNRAYIQLVYPLADPFVYRGLARRLAYYKNLETIPVEEQKQREWDSVRRLVQHAYETTPFYRDRFDQAGVSPTRLQSPEDLKRIPPLTREDLRNHLEELRSRKFERGVLQQSATGGTTDTPTPILRTRRSISEKTAIQLRFNIWAGNRPGDKVFYLWGARQDYNENPSWRWHLYDRHLMRRIWAPTSLFNEEVFEAYRHSLNQLRPRTIVAYPTPLALFCEYLRASGKDFHRPLSAVCTAEPLLPSQRRVIEEVLGTKIFEHYGSREFGMIAAECEQHAGMHVNPAAAYIEYVPLEGAETADLKEMLVTDLLNEGMPLIRYRVNDCVQGSNEQCACGRSYPLIRKVVGRTADLFQLPNGDKVPGVSLTNRVLKVCPGLKKIQIIQETISNFHIRYVRGDDFDPNDLNLLRTNLNRFLPGDLSWSFEEVAEIPRERSGKTRFCISKLASPPQAVLEANLRP
jgi:phenylacetate-CoA ligase